MAILNKKYAGHLANLAQTIALTTALTAGLLTLATAAGAQNPAAPDQPPANQAQPAGAAQSLIPAQIINQLQGQTAPIAPVTPGNITAPTTPTTLLQAETPGAIAAPTLSFVDINSGRFGKLEMDIQDGQFLAGAADVLHLVARNLDLAKGELKSLDIDVKGAHLQDFIVDKMTFSTQGGLTFDSGLLFNQKMMQFTSPALAQVTANISQESLNKFLKAPTTLERLSITATKKGGLLANLLGSAGGGFGLNITNAAIVLGKANHVVITADGKLGVSQIAVPLSAELESQLFLKDGWVQVGDTKLKTAGQEISPQLSDILVKKINNLSNLGHRSDDIHFAFTDLKVTPNRGLVVTGTAQINRLRFGRAI